MGLSYLIIATPPLPSLVLAILPHSPQEQFPSCFSAIVAIALVNQRIFFYLSPRIHILITSLSLFTWGRWAGHGETGIAIAG